LRGVTEFDVVFAAYLVVVFIFVGVISYDLAAPWFAPRCHSVRDLERSGWCLPIGFEGPFADVWANRSVFNARVLATAKFAILSLAFGIAVYFRLHGHPRAGAVAYFCGLATILIFIAMGLILNDFS
jgi:hypothetical protein